MSVICRKPLLLPGHISILTNSFLILLFPSTAERASDVVVHNGTIYITGQVGNPDSDIKGQTREALAKVEALLAKAGSSKEKLLKVRTRTPYSHRTNMIQFQSL